MSKKKLVPLREKIAGNIKARMISAGLTPFFLQAKADIHSQRMDKILNPDKFYAVDANELERIAKVLKVDVRWLLD